MATKPLTPNFAIRTPDGNESPDVPLWLGYLAADVDGKFGAWTPYVPLLQDLTLGNGTANTRYKRLGKTVHYSGSITLGSTSSIGANPPQVSLPFIAASSLPLGSGVLVDISDAGKAFPGMPSIYSNVNYFLFRAVSGLPVTGTVPFTWAAGDILGWAVTYETSAA